MNDSIVPFEDSYHGDNDSPFDQIKHTDEHGNERWLGRELMPLMAYRRWEDFQRIVERAKAAATNSGHDVEAAFSVITEAVPTSGNAPDTRRSNYRLTRFAAYLVAMNGDPHKFEVAQAQAYFAVKAREAEVAPQQPAVPTSFAEALELAAAQQRQIEAKEQQLALAAPKVAIADQFLGSAETIYLNDLAKNLKLTRHRLITVLRDEGVLYADELQYRAGFEDWFEVVFDWIERLGQHKPALKVTRTGVRGIYELLVDGEWINPERRRPTNGPADNRP